MKCSTLYSNWTRRCAIVFQCSVLPQCSFVNKQICRYYVRCAVHLRSFCRYYTAPKWLYFIWFAVIVRDSLLYANSQFNSLRATIVIREQDGRQTLEVFKNLKWHLFLYFSIPNQIVPTYINKITVSLTVPSYVSVWFRLFYRGPPCVHNAEDVLLVYTSVT